MASLAAGCGHLDCCLPWVASTLRRQAPPTNPKASSPQAQAETFALAPTSSAEKGLPQALRRFTWEGLIADPLERHAMCEEMAARGFAIIVAPQAVRELAASMRDLALEFFARPQEERCALGKLRLYREKVVGYRELGGGRARFLEVHAIAGGGAIPRPKAPATLHKVAERLYLGLQDMAIKLIAWLAEHQGIPAAALLQCLDAAALENLEDGDCGASVLRLGWYGSMPQGERASEGSDDAVVFDEHTDASFLTLAAVGSTPGLQMRDPSGSVWLDVERKMSSSSGDMLVFVGDFLEVLSKGLYVAARHRVVQLSHDSNGQCSEAQDASECPQRLSMPFLVRGQPGARFDTRQFLEECPDAPLLRLEGMDYAQMRRFLDLKGRRRFQGERLLAAVKDETGS